MKGGMHLRAQQPAAPAARIASLMPSPASGPPCWRLRPACTHHRGEGDDEDDGEGHKGKQVLDGATQRLHLARLERAACTAWRGGEAPLIDTRVESMRSR